MWFDPSRIRGYLKVIKMVLWTSDLEREYGRERRWKGTKFEVYLMEKLDYSSLNHRILPRSQTLYRTLSSKLSYRLMRRF